MYIYSLPFEPPSHLPPHPTPLSWYRAPVWVSWAIQQRNLSLNRIKSWLCHWKLKAFDKFFCCFIEYFFLGGTEKFWLLSFDSWHTFYKKLVEWGCQDWPVPPLGHDGWHTAVLGAAVKLTAWLSPRLNSTLAQLTHLDQISPETSQSPEIMPSPSKQQGITQDLPPIPCAASTALLCVSQADDRKLLGTVCSAL